MNRVGMVVSVSAALGTMALAGLCVGGCASGSARSVSTRVDGEARVLVNRDRNGLAIQGYDPVAYFTDNAPVRGTEQFTTRYMGATYRFASAAHRDMFLGDPERYAPAYGGYCGYAASINRLSPIDPDFWQIKDGRLILQHNQRAYDLFQQGLDGNVAMADSNWPGLVVRNGSPVKVLVYTDDAGVILSGYDVTTYFTQEAPLMGSPEHAAMFDGATYWFVSENSRRTFENDPARYAPAFGAYCGYAASVNRVSPTNPLIYQIIDGRLVLQHTDEAYRLFNRDAAGNLVKADRNWPGLTDRNGH
ncbi:MAG: YHS domain-containing protein [Phycisphaerales bacterium]|nr:YHS domain-containing protein [Phycisphaerales bacterium]